MFTHTVYSDIVSIQAPREQVWSILVDTARYGEWNPFTYRVDTSLLIGDPVDLYVRMPIRGDRVQVERVTVVQQPERLAWGMKMGFNWLLQAERQQVLTATGPDSCQYQTWDAFSGLLTPLVIKLFGADIQNGFNGVARALKKRAEDARRPAQG